MRLRRSAQKSICLFVYTHESYELLKMSFFDIGSNKQYFKKELKQNYINTNHTLQRILDENKNFKFSLSISGTLLDNFENHDKYITQSFKDLVGTKKVELIAEPYYHSLAWLFSKEEFAEQIKLQMKIMYEVFRKKPKIFRNTELIYNNELAQFIKQMGFSATLASGWDSTLHGKSPNHLYTPVKSGLHFEDKKVATKYAISSSPVPSFKVMLKNYHLSEAFINESDPAKLAEMVDDEKGETINIFIDYEQLIAHKNEYELYSFWTKFVKLIEEYDIAFRTPSDTLDFYNEKYELDQHALASWKDINRELLWSENDIQNGALRALYELEDVIKKRVKSAKEKKEAQEILKEWRKLQNADYFKNMSSTHVGHDMAYDSYINYMNILNDLMIKI